MERSEVEDAPTITTMEERLDDLCIYYMSLGVPYDVFWHGDYCQLKYYEEVYLQKRKILNEEAWMDGVYAYTAVKTALDNVFRGKGHPPRNYIDKPIRFFPPTEAELIAEERQKKQQAIEYLNAFKEAWDRKNG